ncbi:hypothetical protein DL98DRAFT_585792 [Cadophora sp. DSE1049]|nr:hypothetical protein DL98DRAFT_585792 [Cadophora sp. DSE1049]
MIDDKLRRHRLEGYAIAVGFEYTWQEVKELVDIADHATTKCIRKTYKVDASVELDKDLVGTDRHWVQFEAERQVWRATAPTNEPYPKKDPRLLPLWWANLRRIVKAEMQNVMSRNHNTGGRSQDGGFSFVSFVPKEYVLPEQIHLRRNAQEDQSSIKPVMRHQPMRGDGGPTIATPSNSNEGDSTTSPTTSFERQRASSTAGHEESPTFQATPAAFDENKPFHGARFSKDIATHVFCSAAKQQYITPVEKKFMCKISAHQDQDSLGLWAEPRQQAGPEDSGIIACGIFIKSYERETRYYFSKDKSGPRIDYFLNF